MHYQCFHGDRKVVTITAKQKSSTNCLFFFSAYVNDGVLILSPALVICLRSRAPLVYQLFLKLKNAPEGYVPSAEELRLAADMPPLDQEEAGLIISRLKAASLGLDVSDDLDSAPIVCFYFILFFKLLTKITTDGTVGSGEI